MNAEVFTKVYNRLVKVLALIVQDKGGNHLVETQRGKLCRDPVLPDFNIEEPNEEEDDGEELEDDSNRFFF